MTNSHAGFKSVEHASEWLGHCRWYGDKERRIDDLDSRFVVEALVGSSTVRLETVEIHFASGEPSRYVLLRDADNVEADLIEDAETRTWLLDGFAEGRILRQPGGDLQWSTTDNPGRRTIDFAKSSRVFRGEQSNTSIVYANTVMLKLFRKVQSGQNPEVEIGQHLTKNTDFTGFPRLLGSIDLHANGEVTTIAALQQFVPSKGDAWLWLLEGIGDAEFAAQSVEEMGKLGRRTAGLHLALARGTDESFAPKQISRTQASALHRESLVELDDTLLRLDAHGLADVESLGTWLTTALEGLRQLEGTWQIRIHGDYHLGQVLRTDADDFAILDFEGEPSRSLVERRAKASPLRDVAGMLRSFDYASESARRRYADIPDSGFDRWRTSARRAFVEEYTSTVQGSQPLTSGMTLERRQRLTAAFEVHKALYEVRYELGNRPDWLDIPLNGLRRIVGHVP